MLERWDDAYPYDERIFLAEDEELLQWIEDVWASKSELVAHTPMTGDTSPTVITWDTA